MNTRNKQRAFLAGVILLASMVLPVQAQTRLSGFIRDGQSGEILIGANVVESGKPNGTTADNNGYFALVVKVPCTLKISFVGYKPLDLSFTNRKDTLLNIELEPGQDIDEVVVKGIRTPMSNISTLKISEIKQLPALGGKPDVMKSMQLLPGIQAQNEGSSLLLVRGGDPGQNLYLFDNVPIIYVNHLGGFMSVFNPDIINSIDLYKGGFPARYGGRLSSVVDITQREGDRAALKGSLSVGVTDVSFTVEGPTKLPNSSFIVTGRKTLTDPLLMLFSWISEANDFVVGYGFHDLNGKFSWKPDEKNSFHLNLYQGDDYLNFWSSDKTNTGRQKSHQGNAWGNWLASARWNHVVSSRVFWSNSISYSRYRLNVTAKYAEKDTIWHQVYDQAYVSTVSDLSWRSNLKIQVLKGWSVETGVQASYLSHTPNAFYQFGEPLVSADEKIRAFEPSLYLDNRFDLSGHLVADLGARLVYYTTEGLSCLSFEPRARIGLNFLEGQQLHVSYQRVSQNEQLLFTAGSIMNNEVWVPVMPGIAPARSDQYTAGWSGGFNRDRFSAEITGYYKTMSNLATYREGYNSLMGDTDWRNKVVTGGTGTSYGVELMFKKNYGDWTGFVSYAWSHTTRQFPQINKGQEFTFDFDRPHTASLNINHKFNEKWSASLTWVYQTGLPYTPVLGRQLTLNTEPDENGNFGYYETLLYGERNSARMKDYHRLDVGVNYNTVTRRNRRATWTFSVYNLYNRHNPYFYYFNTDATGGYDRPERMTDYKPANLYQMSFFPIIPSVSYRVYFDKIVLQPSPKPQIRKAESKPREIPTVVNLDSYIKNRWTIKAGFFVYPGRHSVGSISNDFRIEADYGLLKNLETGVYLQGGMCTALVPIDSSSFTSYKRFVPSIGISLNFHPLPFIIKRDDFRYDLYFLGRYEMAYYPFPEGYIPARGLYLECRHGIGMAYYFSKHAGFFAEASFKRLDISHWNFGGGLTFKF